MIPEVSARPSPIVLKWKFDEARRAIPLAGMVMIAARIKLPVVMAIGAVTFFPARVYNPQAMPERIMTSADCQFGAAIPGDSKSEHLCQS